MCGGSGSWCKMYLVAGRMVMCNWHPHCAGRCAFPTFENPSLKLVKKSNGDKKTVLQKTLDNGITLVDDVVVDNERRRTYQLMINAEDTEDMTPEQEYEFDVEIVTNKDDTDLKQTIITGNFILTNATTRMWNE